MDDFERLLQLEARIAALVRRMVVEPRKAGGPLMRSWFLGAERELACLTAARRQAKN